MSVFSTHFKSEGISISLHTTKIYNGKTMPNLVLPTRALYVVNKAIDLFHHRGFHLIGVDRIVKESEITKATFYNY
ncbi:bacterial regulatory s, tetR family protein, partial [Acinetobacter baumannii 496487]